MIPIQITLSGFLSYKEQVDLNFEGFDLACISGANGSGKSSLLDAMTWGLFGQARKRDDSIINLQSDKADVEFTFIYEGNIYRVQRVKARNKSTDLEFHIQDKEHHWKALTERTLRATEALIQKTMRLDYETFINASFFLQGKADQFTQQRPGDRKRILSSILGLEIWEQYRKQTVEQRKDIDTEISALDGRLVEINNELAQEDARKERLVTLESSLKTLSDALGIQNKAVEEMRRRAASLAEQDKLVESLRMQAERTRKLFNENTEKLNQRQVDKTEFADILERATAIEKDHQAWLASQKELENWNAIAIDFNESEKLRNAPLTEIETTKTRLEAERDQYLQQEKKIVSGAEKLKTDEKEKKDLEKSLKEIDLQLKERKALELDLKEALKEQAGAKAENPVLREEMDTLKSRIDQLTSTEGAVCPLCGQALNEDERNNLIEELSEDGKIKGDKYRANVDLLAKADEKVNALEGKVSKLMTIDENNRNLTRRLDQIINQENTILEEQKLWETEGAKKLIEIEGKLKTEDFALKTRKTLAKIDEDLKNIGYQVDAHDAERKRELALRSSDVELRKLEHARATLAPLEREIKELEENLVSQGKDLGIQETEFEKAAANLAVAITESPDIFEAENQMLSLQEDENRIRLEVGAAQQEVNVLDSLKKRTAELAVSREYLAQKVAQHKSLERAFGKDGGPAMLIEQALPQIEVKANEILERLSGGSMSINFSTQTAYKDKSREDLRETLDIIISDIAGQRDYEMYSGGEAFRINFAIRLALSEVLAQRAGARLQTLVIDEGFGSQDEIGRQRLIQAINLVKEDFEKILVITHIDSLKDAFPTRIEVEKSETGSTVNII